MNPELVNPEVVEKLPWSQWLEQHSEVLWAFGIASGVMFLGTLILIPIVINKLPEDVFLPKEKDCESGWDRLHPVPRYILLVLKNLLGVVFILVGISMIVLPGQGLLTIFIGVLLINFPGKESLIDWLLTRKPVKNTINWIRRKGNRPPLLMPDSGLKQECAE